MTTLNTQVLTVDEKARGYAKIYASLLVEEFQRKRAYASIVALYALLAKLETTENNVQKAMTLFRNPMINEQYEVSDLYVNNWHIDVRVVTNSGAVLVPKIHYDSCIVPDFYAVIKVDTELKNAELLGFVETATTQKQGFDYYYYSFPLELLISYEQFLEKIKVEKTVHFSEEEHELFRTSYLGFMDNELDVATKNRVLKHLFECSECRTEFCCFTGFEMVSCNAVKYPEIMQDETLSVIGAQQVDDEKYKGKEEKIYIGEDQEDETSLEEKEKTVNDILDELFGFDDDFALVETIEEKPLEVALDIQNQESDIQVIEGNDSLAISNNEDIEMISEEVESIVSSDDIQIISESEIDQIDNDVIVEEPQIVAEEESSVQKVIVDYDEFGEPIYSYISNVEKEDNNSSDLQIITDDAEIEEFEEYPNQEDDYTGIENVEDVDLSFDSDSDLSDSLIEESLDIVENTPEVQLNNLLDADGNGVPDIIEQAQASIEKITKATEKEDDVDDLNIDDLEEISTDAQEEFEEYKEDDVSESFEEEGFEEYKEDDVSESFEEEEFEEYKDDDFSETDVEDFVEEYKEEDVSELFEDESTEEYNQDEKFEEHKEIDDSETDENNLENNVEPVENEVDVENLSNEDLLDIEDEKFEEDLVENIDNQEEEDSVDEEEAATDDIEYEDYDEEEDEEDDEEEEKGKSSKIAALLASIVVLLLLAGGGCFFLFKNKGNNVVEVGNENISDNAIEIPVSSQINDMFEQPIETSNEEVKEVQPVNEQQNQQAQQVAEVKQEQVQSQQPPQQQKDMFEQPTVQQSNPTNPVPATNENDLIKPQQNQVYSDINKAIANAFPGTNPVSFRGLNWFCTSELFSDRVFKNYLQDLDNKLKQNIKNNILNATEVPPKNTVAAKFAVDNNGNLKKVIISESSGSQSIDNIVLQSINESFEGEKSQILNDGALKADMYYLKVVIKL